MDKFARKTLRGVSLTFGTLADTLHLPDSMRCCGVGAIEAQIAAYDDDDGSTSDDSVFAIDREGRENIRGQSSPPRKRKKDKDETTVAKLPPEENKAGGLRGMLSSARSLGWGRRKGGDKGGGDDQSQSSQRSGMSFLSGGLRLLSSAGKNIFKSLGVSSPQLNEGTLDASSDLTSLSLTETSYGEEGPRRSVLLWRHVRMIVRGVRGVRGGVAESSRLEDTVAFRAARRIQGIFRIKRAGRVIARRRSIALEALKMGAQLRLQRRRREADARKRYKEACREEGKRILEWAVKVFLQPRAILDLQRVWRGYRARKRLAAYLKWLEDRARRRREFQRYLEALAATRGAGGRNSEQVKRRVWGREEFAHTGWRPRYDVENPPSMHDHVWAPPRGSTSGVRTFKVLLPPASERDRLTLTGDRNAWAGVPVGIAKPRPPPERLGPPPRPGTITANTTATDDHHCCHQQSVSPSAREDVRNEGEVRMKYNWLPAPLVAKAALLQCPKSGESDPMA
ncbi:unnamed protein product [Ectocarpus fasciculatus]